MNSLKIPSPIADRMNVSAQPKISPFRYPGGKTRLVELVHSWLILGEAIDTFIEPFAGGASVGLYVAAKGLAKNVRLVEIDPDVSAFWITILSNDWKWLCEKISDFQPSRRRVEDVLSAVSSRPREVAFRTLVRNRFGRSGLLWNGAGLVRSGERGFGLASRWYPDTLVSRIRHINSLKDRITFVHGCGLDEIKSRYQKRKTALFVDPPYSVEANSAGKRLYRHNHLDHTLLFELLSESRARFLLTHEDSETVRELIEMAELDSIRLPVLTAQKKKSAELLIGAELDKFVMQLSEDRDLFMEPVSRLSFI